MEVISATKNVFLDGELFLNVDVSTEVTIISSDEIASTTLSSSVLDNDRSVNIVGVLEDLWHGTSASDQPISLLGTAAFPTKNTTISKGRNFEVSEVLASKIFDERSVWNDDDVLFSEPFSIIEHLSIIFEHQPLIWFCSREGFVEATTVFSNSNTKRTEAFHACSVKDLQR